MMTSLVAFLTITAFGAMQAQKRKTQPQLLKISNGEFEIRYD